MTTTPRTSNAARTRKQPARPVPAILFLAQPGARLLLVSDHAHMVAGDSHKRINNPTVDALIELGYIDGARQIDTDILTYALTAAGAERAAELETLNQAYRQLDIPQLRPQAEQAGVSEEEAPSQQEPTPAQLDTASIAPQPEQAAPAPILTEQAEPASTSEETATDQAPQQAEQSPARQAGPARRKRSPRKRTAGAEQPALLEMVSSPAHPLREKPRGYICYARIDGQVQGIRVLAHYLNETVYIDRWIEGRPMFSSQLPYESIEIIGETLPPTEQAEQPAQLDTASIAPQPEQAEPASTGEETATDQAPQQAEQPEPAPSQREQQPAQLDATSQAEGAPTTTPDAPANASQEAAPAQQEKPRRAKRKRLTPEEAKAERAAKRAQIRENVQSGITALCDEIRAGKSPRLVAYLSFAARFHKYSVNNQLLILLQKPDATRVAGYTQWQKMGYQVQEGEKGIAILAPRPFAKTKRDKESGEEIMIQGCAFGVEYVYDVSQLVTPPEKTITEFFGPLADDQEYLYSCIAAAVRGEGITLEIGDTGTAQGYSAGGRIRLRNGLDSTNRVLTLIHEWAHERLHQNPNGRIIPANKKECHAEAIAYIVAYHFGVHNPFASDYLQNWGNTVEQIQTELEIIRTTASAMIERIEEEVHPAPTQESAPVSQEEQPTEEAPAPVALCVCCEQPAQAAQQINDVTVCAACIALDTASLTPADYEQPNDQELAPQPPTPAPSTPPAEQTPAQLDTASQEEQAEQPETAPSQESTPTDQQERPAQLDTASTSPAELAPPDEEAPAPQQAEQPEPVPAQEEPAPAQLDTTNLVSQPEQAPPTQERARPTGKIQTKRVCLNWPSYYMDVLLEGYQKITQIMREYGVCSGCKRHYTPERPQVAGTFCLGCLLNNQPSLTLVGETEANSEGYKGYLFVNAKGEVCTSRGEPGSQEKAEANVPETLKYWRFPAPAEVEKNGKMIDLRSTRRRIIGDPRHDVVILHCWDGYPEDVEAYFALSKDGTCMEINKRKASHRALVEEAKRRIEATKRGGSYYIDGHECYSYDSYEEYQMIAQILAATVNWPL